MVDRSVIVDMSAAVNGRLSPAITRWNRLEGRPRTHDFDRALRAELRDALWMLSRQWQVGEFEGDDAGSPVLARAALSVSNFDRYQAGGAAPEGLTLAGPLETRVERRPVPLRASAQYLSLDLRLVVGRRWLKLLERERLRPQPEGLSADYRAAYVREYGVPVPDPDRAEDAQVCAHAEAWQQAGAAAERAMDGIRFLEHVADPAHNAFDGVNPAEADKQKLAALAGRLRAWYAGLITQPSGKDADAWLPGRLEYQFACSAPDGQREFVTRAEEYYNGHLDWYSLEHRPGEARLGEATHAQQTPKPEAHTFIPSSIVFEGMPNTRWWAFEDRRTNFGEMRPDTTDLGKLLLMEFGLVYANDWFVLPREVSVGTVAQVHGIALTNVFNERFWIEPLREQHAAGFRRWSMFTLSSAVPDRLRPAARLVTLATAPKVQEGPALEEIALVRDEMANMVWGIEKRIPLPTGESKPGSEAALELLDFLRRPFQERLARLRARRDELEAKPAAALTPAEQAELSQITAELAAILRPAPAAPILYEVMNTVPEEWIPFVPVHVAESVREIQLQRAAMPRIIEGDPSKPAKVRPRTTTLRTNFPRAYFVNEEEVPRAGALVRQSYNRTRWIDGRVFTWLGMRKQTGRGEGSSELRFDALVEAPD